MITRESIISKLIERQQLGKNKMTVPGNLLLGIPIVRHHDTTVVSLEQLSQWAHSLCNHLIEIFSKGLTQQQLLELNVIIRTMIVEDSFLISSHSDADGSYLIYSLRDVVVDRFNQLNITKISENRSALASRTQSLILYLLAINLIITLMDTWDFTCIWGNLCLDETYIITAVIVFVSAVGVLLRRKQSYRAYDFDHKHIIKKRKRKKS